MGYKPRVKLRGHGAAAQFGAGVGATVGVILGGLDALGLLTGPTGTSRAWAACGAIALSATMGALTGALSGMWLRLHANGWLWVSPRLRVWSVSASASFPLQVFAVWVPTGWIVDHWEELSSGARAIAALTYVLLPLAVVLSTRLAFWLRERLRTDSERVSGPGEGLPVALLLGALGLAAASYWADRNVLVGLYDDFHVGLAVTSALALALAVALLCSLLERRARAWPWLEPKLGPGALALVGAATAALLALEFSVPAAFDGRGTAVFQKQLETIRGLTDFDGDGASGLLGGLDCGPFDANTSPDAFDLPENGVDENCTGADARWPDPLPKAVYPEPERRPYNVLVLSVDALRADHLGVYGYERNTSPHIDALARRSWLFRNAFAQSPKTFFSLPSLHTGRYPSNITRDYDHPSVKNRKGYAYYLGEDVPTLAESFRQAGYDTALISRLRMLRSLGLARGFEHTAWTKNVARETVRRLERLESPFYAWVHLLEPHDPYEKHAEYDFGDGTIDRYDSEIAAADAIIGKVLAALGPREDDTIVIVTSDHGEAFGEHGLRFHPQELYTKLLHVPLIVTVPGLPPREVASIVELVDLFPTLCELTPIRLGCHRTDGETLLSTAWGARPTRPGGAYASALHPSLGLIRRSLADESFRIIHDSVRERLELYNLRVDPTEQHNVARERPEVVAQLREELDVRPLRRQAELVRRFQESNRVEELTANLDAFHQEELLHYVLDQVPAPPSEAVRSHLVELFARPGLGESLKRRLMDLVPGIEREERRAERGKTKKKTKKTKKKARDERK